MGNCLSRADTNSNNDIELPHRIPQAGARQAGARGPTNRVHGQSGEDIPFSLDTAGGKGTARDRAQYSKGKGKGTAKLSTRSNTPPISGSGSGMNSNTAFVLRTYATLPSPSTSLSPRILLTSTQHTMAIFDAYPKAKYHFLVLPRYPFPSPSDPDSGKSIVQINHLDDLRSLLTKAPRAAREAVIGNMAEMAREVEEMVRDEMVKSEGVEWKIDVGFHAIPSLKHIHLHVISEDRISPALKTKKHYNSFRPDLGFFVSIMDVQRWLQDDDEEIRAKVDALLGSASLLASPLTCFKCDEPFNNIPKLKTHLEKEFEAEKKKGLENIRRSGRQRSSDEEMF